MDLVSFTYSPPWYICIQPCFIFYLDCRFFSICLFLNRIIVHLQRLSRDIYLSLKIALLFAFEESLVSFFVVFFMRVLKKWNRMASRGGGYSTKFYTGRLRLEVYPVTLLYTIFNWKGTLFVYLLYEWYPFNIPIVELCIFYTAVNAPSKYQ